MTGIMNDGDDERGGSICVGSSFYSEMITRKVQKEKKENNSRDGMRLISIEKKED